MRYRTLGGAAASTLTLGAMTFGTETDEATAFRMLDMFTDAGGNVIDTADLYSGGESEAIIGRWIATRPEIVDRVLITTKGRMRSGAGVNDVGGSRYHLRRALEASLGRLGLDHVDLYLLHAWDPLTPVDETLRFFDDAIRAGKISYYGFSNLHGWELTKLVSVARQLGLAAPVALQSQYNLLSRTVEVEVVPAALDAGIGIMTWSPLAGGWLTGKYQRGERPTGVSRLGEDPQRGLKNWAERDTESRTWRVLDELHSVAQELGSTPGAVAIAWLAARPAVSTVVIGVRHLEQLRSNLEGVKLTLPAEHIARLDAASSPELDDYPYYPQAARMRARTLTV